MSKISLFLDSGAFSAWTKKVNININDYISFIKQHKRYIDVYACLDVIGSPEETYENQIKMEEQGLNPLITFHVNEDYKWLKLYLSKYDYIALGGIAKGITATKIKEHLDNCWNIICDTPNRLPKCKIHGFGLTSLRLMFRYPWYSVDSTSWVMTSRMGGVIVPRYKSGKWIYDEQSWKISVSSRSSDKSETGKHIDTFPKQQKQHILGYFSKKGYILGKSEFKFVSKNYKLKSNEKWNGPAIGNKREIEIIIEPGLCNDYKLRDEMNIIYYLDLEKHIPEWPWAFEAKGVKGFAL